MGREGTGTGPGTGDTVVAVVLAGGAGRRMGGADKAALELGGATFLDRVLRAAAGVAGRLVVVGPPRPVALERAVIFVQEADPGGGPVPAVVAALEAAGGAGVVLVLAVDLPLLTSDDLRRLLDALTLDVQADAVAADDHRGRPNPLLAAYRVDALREAVARLPGSGRGEAAARLLPERVTTLDLGLAATLNVNTPDDLERAGSSAAGVADSPSANHSP
jgi:molybdopterin-guanine dinucleotide biosynthesis protein A